MDKVKSFLPAIIGLIILLGLSIRFYHINDNQFLFYDEGMYLGYNRAFLNLVANNPAHNLHELGIILSFMLKTALSTPKALWFFILNLRVFALGTEAWYFARLVSAISGLATVVLLYFWSKRYFKSQIIAILSALLLLVLPSHVFYSRLGMQEALSSFLFLSAIYLYMLQERIRWPFFVSAFLLVCVYLTNYRMIIAPVFIAFIECFKAFSVKRPYGGDIVKGSVIARSLEGDEAISKLNWQKIAIYFASFYGIVLFVGCLYGGINLHVTLAWMFHQAQDAGGKFHPINFLSYPYYVFALEGFFFACFFWGNIIFPLFFIKRLAASAACRHRICNSISSVLGGVDFKEYSKLLPFGLVVLQMLIFSFAAEKGARYLCVVLPFMAAATAVVIDDCWQRYTQARVWVLAFGFSDDGVSFRVYCAGPHGL